MKILHVIDSDGLYGAEMIVLSLMSSQKKRGNYPILLSLGDTAAGTKSIEKECKYRGLDFVPLRFRNGLNLKGALEILKISREMEVDIIHCHGYKSNILLGVLPRRRRRVPVITTVHGWTAMRSLSKRGLYRVIDALVMRKLDRVIAVSSNIMNTKIFKILGIRPVVINNAIEDLQFDNHGFRREFPKIASICENGFKILSIGRLSSEKGFDTLIEAIDQIHANGMEIFLVVIGEGPERPNLEKLINEKGLSNRVFLLGYQREAFHFIPYFDLFVLPSLTEGLPITILEAMQAGTPIVATKVGEIPLLLDNGSLGELIGPGNSKELVSAIQNVYKNKEKAKGKAILAQKKVLASYSLDRMADSYMEQYRIVLSKRQTSVT